MKLESGSTLSLAVEFKTHLGSGVIKLNYINKIWNYKNKVSNGDHEATAMIQKTLWVYYYP